MKRKERKNVYKVYNKIGDWFYENRPQSLMEKNYLDKLISIIPEDGTILDVGCGSGTPIFKYFFEKEFNITGVDASEKMLSIAKGNFLDAKFILSDMRKLALNEKYNAVIAWHSFFHLPSTDQVKMFDVFMNHLKPKGILLFTSGTKNCETWGMNGGENLFHASLDTGEYKFLLEKYQFSVLEHKVDDPECGNATVWMAQYNPR